MPLTNEQYNMLMRVYEEKQQKSRDRQNKRYEAIYSKFPAVKEIDNNISYLSVEQAKKLLNGNTDALAELKQQIRRLSDRRMALLVENGYPACLLYTSDAADE